MNGYDASMSKRDAKNEEMDLLRQAFARRLRLVRIALGFHTNHEFARELGMVENTVGAYQLGLRFPSPVELVKIKQKTGYPIDYLYAADRNCLTGSQRRDLDRAEALLKKEEREGTFQSG